MPFVSAFSPSGIVSAVVLKSAYEQQLLKGLKDIKDDFLARIRDRSDLVGYDVLDLTKAGAEPNVLIDNTVYPIPAAQRTDEGVKLQLRKLTTEVSVVTRDEIYALPYDKQNDIIKDHKNALQKSFRSLAMYSFCPAGDTSTTPVLVTTGEDDGTGRKRLTHPDLVKFRRKLDDLGVGECDLVLSNEHVEDIRLWSQTFEKQYTVLATGMILPLYGFYISINQGYAPRFNTGIKVAYGSASDPADVKASVAFPAERMVKGYGSVEMFYAEAEPRNQQTEVNFNAHFIAVPKDTEGTGAIISGRVV